jgi:hypothetical protein
MHETFHASQFLRGKQRDLSVAHLSQIETLFATNRSLLPFRFKLNLALFDCWDVLRLRFIAVSTSKCDSGPALERLLGLPVMPMAFRSCSAWTQLCASNAIQFCDSF